jgi:hypothetical protein
MTTFCNVNKLCSLSTRRIYVSYDSHNKYEFFSTESVLCEMGAVSSYECLFSEG